MFALSLCDPTAPWDLGSVWDARPGVGGLQLCRTEGGWLRGEGSVQQQLKTLRKGPDFHRPTGPIWLGLVNPKAEDGIACILGLEFLSV